MALMQFLLFLPLICLTLFFCVRIHGPFTFVTMGAIGAAIYSIPAIVDRELPFFAIAYGQRTLLPTPDDADLVAFLAWIGLLVGAMAAKPRRGPQSWVPGREPEEALAMGRLAFVNAVLAASGMIYLVYTQGASFLLAERSQQSIDAVSLLWKWTAPLGLIASSLARSRKLLIYHSVILFAVFLRGDRTMVAITAAALVVTAAYQNRTWYVMFTPTRILGAVLAIIGVFFGKSAYLTLKSGFSGQGWVPPSISLQDQFISHFEPFTTYSHLGYVMSIRLHLGFGEFVESVLANLLILPSYFGFSTDLYNSTVTATLPAAIRFGVAGNYLAHGWVAGGTFGAVAFYFLLAVMLRLCDAQFQSRSGALKLFWCCTGGVIAFYVHRNGLDNLFSFVRQIGIVCILLAAVAVVSRMVLGAPGPVSQAGRGHDSTIFADRV
jgi:hypothetical protein